MTSRPARATYVLLVTGIITEAGGARAVESDLLKLWPRHREDKAYLT